MAGVASYLESNIHRFLVVYVHRPLVLRVVEGRQSGTRCIQIQSKGLSLEYVEVVVIVQEHVPVLYLATESKYMNWSIARHVYVGPVLPLFVLPFILLISHSLIRSFNWFPFLYLCRTTAEFFDMVSPETFLSRHDIEVLIAQGQTIVIYEGYALRLDRWLEKHPGGKLPIFHMVGRDATDEINV